MNKSASGFKLFDFLIVPNMNYSVKLNNNGHARHASAQLNCRFSHFRHAMLNDILHRVLSSANVPSRLEPTGLDRADGKRPDGITMVPGLIIGLARWDATSV